MKERILCFLLLGFFLIGTAEAQVRRISGKVTSASDGSPLVGVSVRAIGSSSGGQTDAQGNFAFNAPADVRTLEFSSVGYEPLVVDLT
ncbi:MAG TPA: carboxypeptidase-like regulatory domain-containing protein, partial [Sphingobacteriaceae bacterium]|nr:carboxypeptidase-like regulatory domain-containing protein [Sphingobacteriaceae bacterium]